MIHMNHILRCNHALSNPSCMDKSIIMMDFPQMMRWDGLPKHVVVQGQFLGDTFNGPWLRVFFCEVVVGRGCI